MAIKSIITGERNSEGFYEITAKDKSVKFPSVTTILSIMEDKEVEQLRDAMDPEMWAYVSKRGADRGSVMHAYLENYAIGLDEGKNKDDALLFSQTETPKQFTDINPKFFNLGREFFYNIYNSEFNTEFVKPVLVEGLMISPKYKYAGRTDIVYIDNEENLVLGDYKTSTKPIKEHQRKLIKYKIQLAAYAQAFFEMYKKKPAYCAIWVASPDGYQKFILHENEMDVYLTYFLHLVDRYYKEYIKQ